MKTTYFAIALTCLLFACSGPQKRANTGDDAPSRSMIGLDDEPLTDEWKNWTPVDGPPTPTRIADVATAFDYWQIEDPYFSESAWAALFAILGELRSSAPAEYEKTFRMLMTVLEPGGSDGARFVDLTFFASKPEAESPWEGIGVRIWRELPSGSNPAVSALLRRQPGGPKSPSDLFVWLHSDVEETASMSVRLRSAQGRWLLTHTKGITMAPTNPLDGEAGVLASILTQTFWQPFTDSGYLDTNVEYLGEKEASSGNYPMAFGATLDDRDIDQVFTDSVFAPRLTNFPAP